MVKRRLVRILFALAALLAAVYAVLAARAAPRAPHPYFEGGAQVVIAHQGGDGLWPGNTLLAMEGAAGLSEAVVLEMDVHASADGELVLMHDATVERTTDGRGAVAATSLAELRALDAGYGWSPGDQGESFPYRGRGIAVPTLRQILERFPERRMVVEIKQTEPSITTPLCGLIREHEKAGEVLVASFDDATLRTFRRDCPEVATSATPTEVRLLYVLSLLRLEHLFRAPAEALQVPEHYGELHLVTERFLRAAHSRNMRVQVWTVNDSDAMRRLLDLGVDGLITDRPDRLLELLGDRP